MSFRKKLISVVIATHKRPELLTATLNCLAEQTYRPFEIVIVDDGSDTTTADAVNAWKSQVRPVFDVTYQWQENQGPATARNRGVEASHGELILFLDDDDLLCPDALEHLACAIDGRQTAIAMAQYQVWEGGNPQGPLVRPRSLHSREVLRSMIQGAWFVPIHGYLFTRTALEEMGAWNPVLTSQEDDEFLLRAALAGISFCAAPKATVYYRQHYGVRRATPGKPGESVTEGLKKRMIADVMIRESVFEALRETGGVEPYRADFLLWQMRLRQRYSSVLSDFSLQSVLLDWLETDIDENMAYPIHSDECESARIVPQAQAPKLGFVREAEALYVG